MNELKDKTWEELCLQAFKAFNERKKLIEKAINELEELEFLSELDVVQEYLDALKNNIRIPSWNLYPHTNPSQLDIYVEKYYVFMKPDYFMEAQWKDGNFYVFNEYRENGKNWDIEADIKYWLPITYPTPY